MQPLEKLKMMEKIVRELDDVQHSQTSVLKKISQVEADNINLGNAALEKQLTDIYAHVSTNLEAVIDLHRSFSQETDEFRKVNKLDAVPDLETN
jgi:hypothetical protein